MSLQTEVLGERRIGEDFKEYWQGGGGMYGNLQKEMNNVLRTEGYLIMGKRFFVEVLMNPEERNEGEAWQKSTERSKGEYEERIITM